MSSAQRRVHARVDQTHVHKHTAAFADFPLAVREMVWNAADAGADRITLRFEKVGRKRHLYFIDNGIMSDVGLEAIVSMDFSPSAADPDKRGQNGNGSKGFVHHSERFEVRTRRPGEDTILSIGFSLEELLALWRNGEALWDSETATASSDIQNHGTTIVWRNLGTGTGVNAAHPRTAKRLVKELGNLLPVRVIDERGKEHKLEPRQLMGNLIEGDGMIGEMPVNFAISVLANPTTDDSLDMWAWDPVCSMRTFLHRVRPTPALAPLLRSVRSVLDNMHVAGMIAIPNLNRFSVTSRDGFHQDLYDDDELVFNIIRWLHAELVPKVEQRLGARADEIVTSGDDEMLAGLVNLLQQAGDGAPQKPDEVTDVVLRTSITNISIEPGQQRTIEVERPQDGKTYRWSDSKSGGQLDKKTGTQVVYTAGSDTGDFTITLKCGSESHTIKIKIVQELPFGFTLRARDAMPGQRLALRLQNAHHTTGQFTWDDSTCGGVLEVAPDGLNASYTAGDKLDLFKVTVVEVLPGDATREPKRATCTIRINSRTAPKPPRRVSESEFVYSGATYELTGRSLRDGLQDQMSFLYPTRGDRPTRILLNFSHPGFVGRKDNERRLFALTQIAMRIAENTFREQPGEILGVGELEAIKLIQQNGAKILATLLETHFRASA